MLIGSKIYQFLSLIVEFGDEQGTITRQALLQKLQQKLKMDAEDSKRFLGDQVSLATKGGFIDRPSPGVYSLTSKAIEALEQANAKGTSVGFDWRR